MQANKLCLTDRCTLLAALRRSMRYLHHHLLRTNTSPLLRSYWLAEIREAYRLYRSADFTDKPSAQDRYHALVEFVTPEQV